MAWQTLSAALLWILLGGLYSAPAQSIIGVLGIAHEVAPVEARLEGSRDVVVHGYVFRTGRWNGRNLVVGRSGIGKVNAAIITTLLITRFHPSVIFFSGTAGAIDPSLSPGDVVIGASVAQHDVGTQTSSGFTRHGLRNAVTSRQDPILVPAPEKLLAAAGQAARGVTLPRVRTSAGERSPRITGGIIVTGDVFLADPERREEIRKNLGASAVEMEGAAVAQTCRQFDVSCLIVRSITDRADGQALASYKEFVGTASQNAATLVLAAIDRLP